MAIPSFSPARSGIIKIIYYNQYVSECSHIIITSSSEKSIPLISSIKIPYDSDKQLFS
jgi:hypothetical protein